MITTLLCFVIRAYQLLISPYLPARCRYLPTCSAYALAALKKHGGAKGTYVSFKRVCRCHPWGGSGHDPVP